MIWTNYDESPGAEMAMPREGDLDFREAMATGSLFGGLIAPCPATQTPAPQPVRPVRTVRSMRVVRRSSVARAAAQISFPAYLRRYYGLTHHQFGMLKPHEQVEIHRAWMRDRETLSFIHRGETLVKYVALAVGGMILTVLTRGWWG